MTISLAETGLEQAVAEFLLDHGLNANVRHTDELAYVGVTIDRDSVDEIAVYFYDTKVIIWSFKMTGGGCEIGRFDLADPTSFDQIIGIINWYLNARQRF